jgi:hypothetical protein
MVRFSEKEERSARTEAYARMGAGLVEAASASGD